MLTVIAPPEEAGRSVAIDPRGTVVGRDAASDLVLSSDRISRRHAVVRIRDGRYEVEDLGSKNGTLLNGDPVMGTRRLQEADRLALADVEIEVRLAGTAEAPPRSQPPAGAAWQPDRSTEVSRAAPDRPDQPPQRSLRRDLQEAPSFSAKALVLAAAGSVVGTVVTGAAGTGPWGTLAGAAVLPVVGTAFSTKRAGEGGRVRAATIVLLSLGALVISWTGFSLADLAAGKSVIPGSEERPNTFPGLAADDRGAGPTATHTPGPVSVVEVSPVDCGTVTVGSSVGCRLPAVITYNGGGRLHITRIEMTGGHPGDFAADNACVGEWLTPMRKTCPISVTFQPSAAGQRNATLVVHQNLPPPDRGTSAALVGIGGPTDGRPDTCLQGYVWREAVPGDHVCVTPETRTLTRQDNQLADSRRDPAGGAFGVDTCLQGFVWREAVPGDHVCVTPETRTQARQDNQLADSRRVG